MMRAISDAEFCELSASFFTSSATMEKPRPDSPARAASIEAFRDRILIFSAIASIVFWDGYRKISNGP
jgi:hypothetical protein